MVHRVAAQTIAARFKEIRAASAAGGGTALTTTLSVISIPFGSDWLSVTARNLSGADVVRFALNPRLTIIQTTDALATTTNRTDLSKELQDGDATDVQFDAMSTAANDDFIYVGADVQFRGANVAVGSDPQNTASVLTVKYWEGGSWLDITDSDGTETGGNTTMAQDGDVTWTVPDPWVRESLENIGDTSLTEPWAKLPLYWTRWEFSATTEATWNLAAIHSLNRSTAYAELIDGQTYEQALHTSAKSIANVEALTDLGTANVIVNVATEEGEVFD